MRRKVGLGAIQERNQQEARFKEKSEKLAKEQISKLTQQMDIFKEYLQEFAAKHKKEIKKNSEFRRHFQEMCATVGVDPLQCSNNFWTKLLGVGDFYYELGIQIIEVCMSTSSQNGGLITIEELLKRANKSRGKRLDAVTIDDIFRAINKLHILGGGLKLIKSNKSYIVQSIARELNTDQFNLINLAYDNNGFIDKKLLKRYLEWDDRRIEIVINDLIMESLIWIDDQSDPSPSYYFPAFFNIETLEVSNK